MLSLAAAFAADSLAKAAETGTLSTCDKLSLAPTHHIKWVSPAVTPPAGPRLGGPSAALLPACTCLRDHPCLHGHGRGRQRDAMLCALGRGCRPCLHACAPAHPCRYNEVNHHRFPPGTDGRPFAYFVLTGGRFLYASAARLAVLKVVVSLSVSGDG